VFGFSSSEGLKGGSSPAPAWLAVGGKVASKARGARDRRIEGRDRRREGGVNAFRSVLSGVGVLIKEGERRIPLKLQTIEAISEERSTEVTGVRKRRSRFLRCNRHKDQGHNSGATPASLLTGATIGIGEDFGTCFSVCVIYLQIVEVAHRGNYNEEGRFPFGQLLSAMENFEEIKLKLILFGDWI
ncbi:hypothetical protein U1Q18_023441, partial [Sarracenia purpurea var. burkii]